MNIDQFDWNDHPQTCTLYSRQRIGWKSRSPINNESSIMSDRSRLFSKTNKLNMNQYKHTSPVQLPFGHNPHLMPLPTWRHPLSLSSSLSRAASLYLSRVLSPFLSLSLSLSLSLCGASTPVCFTLSASVCILCRIPHKHPQTNKLHSFF